MRRRPRRLSAEKEDWKGRCHAEETDSPGGSTDGNFTREYRYVPTIILAGGSGADCPLSVRLHDVCFYRHLEQRDIFLRRQTGATPIRQIKKAKANSDSMIIKHCTTGDRSSEK